MAKKKATKEPRKEVRLSDLSVTASYDTAKTTVNDENHWRNADFQSPVTENNRSVRRTLVNRARYETYNNCYGLGTVFSIAESVIGTGVRLHFVTGNDDMDEKLSDKWTEQSEEIDLTDKLQLMELAEIIDGEVFPVFQTNPELTTDSLLDMVLIPTERVQSRYGALENDIMDKPNQVDGLFFDSYGNFKEADVLKTHPSESNYQYQDNEFVTISSKYISHYFVKKRVGEKRQVPRITPALPLFAQLRRFTLAVLDSAETAAGIAGIVQSDAPADGEIDYIKPMDTIEIPKHAMMTLPQGWKMGQMKAEQPTTGYAEFKNEILMEAVRCILMPRNVAKGDSSDYNYSSGMLDKQQWEKSIAIRRKRIINLVLKKYVKLWLDELELIIPKLKGLRRTMKIEYFWDGDYHADPVKDANADMQNLANNTDTLKDICARRGDDYRKVLKQRKIEKDLLELYGLNTEEILAKLKVSQNSQGGDKSKGAPVTKKGVKNAKNQK